ncbi:hypothetical protein [Geminisphaera colitermitum]|uniref:hypothetical protein n=1 Tax=Geminisphaera colitermitum TaxID=1148786 RepID=UPI000158C9B2|nr:hypothetical protein [Geminisphaera colitermitum]
MIRPLFILVFSLSAFQLFSATPIKDAHLTGNATVADGATLTIATGGTLALAEGATVNGLQPLDSTLTALSGKTISTFAYTLLDDNDATSARATLGLGTAATTPATAYATAAQGALAATAVQPGYFGYASFRILLGGIWVEFELKCTVSNFGEHTPFTDLYLYFHSPDPARTTITSQTGPKPTVFFTDSGWTDHRRWRKQTATQSIWSMRSDAQATIAAAIAIVPADSVISPTNANLVWSYCRISATDYERDAAGRVIWHPITPDWLPVLPTP